MAKTLTEDELLQRLSHCISEVRRVTAMRDDVPAVMLEIPLRDHNEYVRICAVQNKNITTAQLERALLDTSWRVREIAQGKLNWRNNPKGDTDV